MADRAKCGRYGRIRHCSRGSLRKAVLARLVVPEVHHPGVGHRGLDDVPRQVAPSAGAVEHRAVGAGHHLGGLASAPGRCDRSAPRSTPAVRQPPDPRSGRPAGRCWRPVGRAASAPASSRLGDRGGDQIHRLPGDRHPPVVAAHRRQVAQHPVAAEQQHARRTAPPRRSAGRCSRRRRAARPPARRRRAGCPGGAHTPRRSPRSAAAPCAAGHATRSGRRPASAPPWSSSRGPAARTDRPPPGAASPPPRARNSRDPWGGLRAACGDPARPHHPMA